MEEEPIELEGRESNAYYLCYTNLLLIIPIGYFLFNIQTETPKIEFLLATMLLIVIYFSQQFWKNPIKHSRIHRIDAIVAKITIVSFILYTLFKFSNSFDVLWMCYLVLFAIVTSFYFSNKYSNEEWCSNKHLCCHGLLHIFCFIATFYAFLPLSPLDLVPLEEL
jgi:FlaA1/EpsC-like NDP-sugar epimerase